MKASFILLAAGTLAVIATGVASAHFRLLEPASMHKGDNGGKGIPPCGEGPASGIISDAVGGHPLRVRFQEWVFHPGHYRIALAVHSPSELPPDPDVVQADGKSISTTIENPPIVPVLLDGVFPHTEERKEEFQVDVPLPNINCDNCTLQVIEFMAQHGANVGGGFFYHHCAAVRIKSDPTLPPADPAWSRLGK